MIETVITEQVTIKVALLDHENGMGRPAPQDYHVHITRESESS